MPAPRSKVGCSSFTGIALVGRRRTSPRRWGSRARAVGRDLSAQAAAAANASEERVRQRYPTVATGTKVDPLDSALALVRLSRGCLVVVGFGGGTGSRYEGSASVRGLDQVAQAVLGRAACPVVVVPDGAATTDDVAVAKADGDAEDDECSAR